MTHSVSVTGDSIPRPTICQTKAESLNDSQQKEVVSKDTIDDGNTTDATTVAEKEEKDQQDPSDKTKKAVDKENTKKDVSQLCQVQ